MSGYHWIVSDLARHCVSRQRAMVLNDEAARLDAVAFFAGAAHAMRDLGHGGPASDVSKFLIDALSPIMSSDRPRAMEKLHALAGSRADVARRVAEGNG